jgi:hypothetical protein
MVANSDFSHSTHVGLGSFGLHRPLVVPMAIMSCCSRDLPLIAFGTDEVLARYFARRDRTDLAGGGHCRHTRPCCTRKGLGSEALLRTLRLSALLSWISAERRRIAALALRPRRSHKKALRTFWMCPSFWFAWFMVIHKNPQWRDGFSVVTGHPCVRAGHSFVGAGDGNRTQILGALMC